MALQCPDLGMTESADDTIHSAASDHTPDIAVICNILLVSSQTNFVPIRQVQTKVSGRPSRCLSCDRLTRLPAFGPVVAKLGV
jgi:hypothetical protein